LGFGLFKKTVKKKENEGFVLWQSGKEPAGKKEEKDKPRRLFNIPVHPCALPGNGKIITVQGAVKGDGASTAAVNLAGALAFSNPERTVLADLDGYGSIRSRMGLPVGEVLVNILEWNDIHGIRDIARGLLSHSSGVMVIPGVVHADQVDKVTPDLVFKMISLLKEAYDYIILDCAPVGMDNNTWAAALVSDVVVTVVKPDRTSIDMFGENNGFLNRLGCQERVTVVLNQAGIPGGIRPGEVESGLGQEIAGILPYSTGVAESNNRRQMCVRQKYRDEYSKAVRLLADRLFFSERGGGFGIGL